MALASVGFRLSVDLIETSGNIVTRTYYGNDDISADYDTFATAAAVLLTRLQLMTDSKVAGYRIENVIVDDALTLPSAAENNNQALFTGKIIGNPLKSAVLSIPAIKASLMVAASGKGFDVVNMSNATVVNWVNLFDSAVAEGDWLISDGESWDNATVFGRRRNTKSTNS